MSKVCQITGKRALVGNNVAHSNKRTKRKFKPNLFDKKFYLEEEKRYVKLRVSAAGIRIINRQGLKTALNNAKNKGFIANY
jgi:large subunit ribosomal protein L28